MEVTQRSALHARFDWNECGKYSGMRIKAYYTHFPRIKITTNVVQWTKKRREKFLLTIETLEWHMIMLHIYFFLIRTNESQEEEEININLKKCAKIK